MFSRIGSCCSFLSLVEARSLWQHPAAFGPKVNIDMANYNKGVGARNEISLLYATTAGTRCWINETIFIQVLFLAAVVMFPFPGRLAHAQCTDINRTIRNKCDTNDNNHRFRIVAVVPAFRIATFALTCGIAETFHCQPTRGGQYEHCERANITDWLALVSRRSRHDDAMCSRLRSRRAYQFKRDTDQHSGLLSKPGHRDRAGSELSALVLRCT